LGQFQVKCSQLCGDGHTYMTAPVRVLSSADFQAWVESQQKAVATPTPTPTPSSTAPVKAVTIDLRAKNIAFDLNTITVPAGADVTINFDNQDTVPHNFSLYTNSGAATVIFQGQILNGPGKITYKFVAPVQPGTYFFRCDVHPQMMTGSFIVQ